MLISLQRGTEKSRRHRAVESASRQGKWVYVSLCICETASEMRMPNRGENNKGEIIKRHEQEDGTKGGQGCNRHCEAEL